MPWRWQKFFNLIAFTSTICLTLSERTIFAQILTNQPQLNSSVNTKQLKRVGKFLLVYQPSANQSNQFIQQVLQKSEIFESIIEGLNNSNLVMRVDIPVIFKDCGVVNAFYDSRDHSITMCYDLTFQIAKDLQKLHDLSPEEAFVNAIYTSIFIFNHELGHALIDVLSLPAVGKEEDSVDQFAAFILLNTGNSELAKKTIFNAATWFGSSPEIPAWDVHAPNDVRFFNLLCLAYGSNPNEYNYLLKILPQQRATGCPSEYAQVAASWQKLLLPHFAEVNRPWGNTRPSVTNPSPSRRGVRPGRIW